MYRPKNARELWETIAERSGAPHDEARTTARALLELLGPSLSLPALKELSAIPGLDVDLTAAGSDAPKTLDDLVERAAARAHTKPSHALEIAAVTGAVLAEIGGAAPVLEGTSPDIRALFIDETAPAAPPAPPHPKPELAKPRTLAEGRSQAATPLFDAKGVPPQHGSIVDENPHASTKLSSVHRDDTLAAGKPR